MGKLRDDSNFQVYGWMASKLKLKGNELLIYAIIYSFSRNDNGNGVFSASTSYLSEWTGMVRKNVINSLAKLMQKNLIIKLEDNARKRKPNVYTINRDELNRLVTKSNMTSYETTLALVTKSNMTSYETTHNNNIINTIDNNNIYSTTIEAVVKKYKSEITGRITCSPLEIDKLTKLFAEYGEKLNEAIEIAVMRNKKSLSYIEGVLKNGGYTNGSKRTEARTSRPSRVFKNRKVETIEDAEAKFRNETSGWD